jgi:hypothetical protein
MQIQLKIFILAAVKYADKKIICFADVAALFKAMKTFPFEFNPVNGTTFKSWLLAVFERKNYSSMNQGQDNE